MKLDRHHTILMLLRVYVVLIFFVALGLWMYIAITEQKEAYINYYFNVLMALLPVSTGTLALFGLQKIQRSMRTDFTHFLFIATFSVYCILWGFGTYLYMTYWVDFYTSVPFPSVADIFYVAGFVFHFFTALLLIKMQKITDILGKAVLIFSGITTFLCIVSLYFFLNNFQSVQVHEYFTPMVFLNLWYVGVDLFIVILVAVFCYVAYNAPKRVEMTSKAHIYFLLSGFSLQYIADLAFAFTTQSNKYYVGNWVDMLFVAVFTLYALSLTEYFRNRLYMHNS